MKKFCRQFIRGQFLHHDHDHDHDDDDDDDYGGDDDVVVVVYWFHILNVADFLIDLAWILQHCNLA
jgi:hypothetical protein